MVKAVHKLKFILLNVNIKKTKGAKTNSLISFYLSKLEIQS